MSRVRMSPVRAGRGALIAIIGMLVAGAAVYVALEAMPARAPDSPQPSRFLYVWASDADGNGSDFLAVYDVSPDSVRQGRLLTTVPVGLGGKLAHHTEFEVAPNGLLLANQFQTRQNFIFDMKRPERPRLRGALRAVPGFDYPHSFARLSNGHVLVTYQNGNGTREGDPGGLVHFDERGRLLRATSAADRVAGGKPIRPSGIAVLPMIDRVLTTSRPMRDETAAEVVQLWRLSDLRLLTTIPLEPRSDHLQHYPFEPRTLPDGRSVLIATDSCGVYLASGLDGASPGVRLVHTPINITGRGCSVPVLKGNYWLLPVAFSNTIVSLDISDAEQPREVHRLNTTARFFPHWLAADPRSNRIVATDKGDGESRVLMLRLDPANGKLSIDSRFGEENGSAAGVSLVRSSWPHGATGDAIPHAAVFGR